MSLLLSTEQICERALRKIGAFAIRSSGARPEEVAETRYWLDMVIGHEASRLRTWWLIPSAGTFPLAAGVDSYDLTTALGPSQAPDGIQFPVMAVLYNADTAQDIHELPLVRGEEWQRRNLGPDLPLDVRTPDDRPQDTPTLTFPPRPPGPPIYVYIDRRQKPTLRCFPAPDAGANYGVRLLFQSFASNFVTAATLDKTTQLRTSMNLWIVTALAHQIANGPVRKLPKDEVDDMRQEAERLRDELEAYDWQEQANEPRRVSYFNGI